MAGRSKPSGRPGTEYRRVYGQCRPARADGSHIKQLTQILAGISNDELKQIPIVPAGTQLKQGAVYLDLKNPGAEPVSATGQMVASEKTFYAPKAEVPYEIWNRLIEILCPSSVQRTAARGSEMNANPTGSPGEPLSEAMIDETVAQSFPASDPPSWTTGRDIHNPSGETQDDN